MSELYYRLEFNEQKQRFHLERGLREENTHGWVTISGKVTNDEYWFFVSFLSALYKGKMTNKSVFSAFEKFMQFRWNLFHNRITETPESDAAKLFAVNWNEAPKWANYHFFDARGEGFWCEDEPFTLGFCWMDCGKTEPSGNYVDASETIWMDSLHGRPSKFFL